MKLIQYRETQVHKPKEIIQTVIEIAQGEGATMTEIRQRLRILDRIEKSDAAGLKLPVEEWDLLKNAFGKFKFSVAHKDLAAIHDDIVNAKDVPDA